MKKPPPIPPKKVPVPPKAKPAQTPPSSKKKVKG